MYTAFQTHSNNNNIIYQILIYFFNQQLTYLVKNLNWSLVSLDVSKKNFKTIKF